VTLFDVKNVFFLLLLTCFLVGCSSDPIPVLRRSAPVDSSELKVVSQVQTNLLIPQINHGRHSIFKTYKKSGQSVLRAGAMKRLDFSGVAFDTPRTATLVTPRHVVMAAHFSRGKGQKVTFHDARGRPHVRTIIGTKRVKSPEGARSIDSVVGLLDMVVPVAYYRVLPPRDDYADLLTNALAVLTNQYRKIFIHRVTAIQDGYIRYGPLADRSSGVAGKIIKGDSSNPTFLLINDELVLIETRTGGGFGSGPFYSDPVVFAAVNRAIKALGAGGQLTPFPLNE